MSHQKDFNPAEFVQKVLKACQFGNIPEKTRLALEKAIERRLAERITATTVTSFGDKEMTILDKIITSKPEIDHFDAVMMAASHIPNIEPKIMKAIQDLYEELTYDAAQIKKSIISAGAAKNYPI